MLLPLQPLSHATDEVDFSSVRTALGCYAGLVESVARAHFRGGVASGAELRIDAGLWLSSCSLLPPKRQSRFISSV